VHDRLNARGAGAPPRILIISPWETVWSLGTGSGVKAGVSDDDRFIDGFIRAGYELHFLRPESLHTDPRVTTHTYPNFFHATRSLPTAAKRALWPALFNLNVAPRTMSLARSLSPVIVMGHSHYATFATWRCRRRTGIPAVTKLFGVMDLVHTEWSATRYYAKNFEQLAANVLDFDIQITKPTREHRDMGAVMIQVGPGLTDDEIKVEADVCRMTKPGAGRQTDGVISRVVRSEREAAVGRTTRIDDRMVTFNLL